MKPAYLIGIGVVVLIIVVFVVSANNRKKEAQKAATLAALSSPNPGGSLAPGGSSNVAQIINSLFPFFNTAITNSNKPEPKKEEFSFLDPIKTTLSGNSESEPGLR